MTEGTDGRAASRAGVVSEPWGEDGAGGVVNASTVGAPVAAGQVLAGRYRVLDELLGEGPAGHVVAALDELLRRRVAVKVLDRVGDGVAARRAVRAARAASGVLDERVVRILDLSDRLDDQTPFVVLEYLEGRPLSAVLEAGPLGAAEAARVRTDLLDAVAALHDAGAVHRDLRADNVLVTPGGAAVLTSAGLTEASLDHSLGLRLGTEPARDAAPSPEQRRGAPADARSDVYALGVLLARVEPSAPADVAAVLRRATQEDPAGRQPDAKALRDELTALAVRPTSTPASEPTVPLAPASPVAPAPPPPVAQAPEPAAQAPEPAAQAPAPAARAPEPLAQAPSPDGESRRRGLRTVRELAVLGAVAAAAVLGVRLAEPILNRLSPAPAPVETAQDPEAGQAGGGGGGDQAEPEARQPAAGGAGPGAQDDSRAKPAAGNGTADDGTEPAAAPATPPAPPTPALSPRYATLVTDAQGRDDLGSTSDLVARLGALDGLSGAERAAEIAALYGAFSTDAEAGTPTSDLSARASDLLRPELSLEGLAGAAEREDGADAERIAALPGLLGEQRAVESADLYGRARVDDLAVSPELWAAAVATLERELSLTGLAALAERDPAAQGPASPAVAAELRRLPALDAPARAEAAEALTREVWTRVATNELARPYGQAVTDAIRPLTNP